MALTLDGFEDINSYQSLNVDDQYEWWFALSYTGRLIGYLVFLGLLVLAVSLILKYLEKCGGDGTNEDRFDNNETSPLRTEKAEHVTYGTYEFDDLESAGDSAELYDGKVCIICYDEERNCFFVPCGHCATCISCAKRIFVGDSKTCPVCRRYIGRVKKLFAQ